MREEYWYDHVILLFSDWSIPNLNDQADCQVTCKAQYRELYQRQNLVASNQIRDLNLLLSNALLAARAFIAGQAIFVVVRDVFCNYCIPREQLAVCKVTRPLFPSD